MDTKELRAYCIGGIVPDAILIFQVLLYLKYGENQQYLRVYLPEFISVN